MNLSSDHIRVNVLSAPPFIRIYTNNQLVYAQKYK